jgi:hypothetical protein
MDSTSAETSQKPKAGEQSLAQQALAQLVKSRKESVLGQVKAEMAKIVEAKKTIAIAEAAIAKLESDFNAGII